VASKLTSDNSFGYTVIMIRTQISLSESDYKAAKREAKRLGISLAEFLRRTLRGALSVDTSKPWMKYAGMVESGDPNSSNNVDEIIYGQKD
jgi:hypothetical protein